MDGQRGYYRLPDDDDLPVAPVKDLRDEFAMASLPYFASLITLSKPETMLVVADLTYAMAGAMLTARSK